MSGQKVGPVQLRIGSSVFNEVLHVAPIEDDILLGFDFLVRQGAKLDMQNHLLTIGSNTTSLRVGSSDALPRVCRISVAKRRVIPPHSATRVKCQLDGVLPDYIVEVEESARLVVPRTVHRSSDSPCICVGNTTDRYMIMKKGRFVGSVTEADILPE